jgi:hypothetical protein
VNREVSEQIRDLRRDIAREFGTISRLAANFVGPVLLWSTRREERRVAAGKTYEPPTILERRNWVATQES